MLVHQKARLLKCLAWRGFADPSCAWKQWIEAEWTKRLAMSRNLGKSLQLRISTIPHVNSTIKASWVYTNHISNLSFHTRLGVFLHSSLFDFLPPQSINNSNSLGCWRRLSSYGNLPASPKKFKIMALWPGHPPWTNSSPINMMLNVILKGHRKICRNFQQNIN